MKKLLLPLLSLLMMLGFSEEAKATHVYGGEIFWECEQNPSSPNFGRFRFTMNIYRDCSPGTAGLGATASLQSNSPAGNIPLTRTSVTDESPSCAGGPQIICGVAPPGNFTGTAGKGPIELHVYRSQWILLTGTPPATGWHFVWTLCCRPAGVQNLVGSSGQQFTLRAFMFPYNPGTGGGNLNTNPCYDNSSTFLEPPSLIICTGYPFVYNQNAFDTDLDSLWYDFATGMSNTGANWGNPSNYAAGFSAANPMPGPNLNPNNVPASIDGATGRITFTSFTTGAFTIVVKVEAWRCGQKIAEIYRDITAVLGNCPPTASGNSNQPPKIALSTAAASQVSLDPVLGPNNDTLYYLADVYAGEVVSFLITATDFDFNPGTFSPQSITFSAAGGNLGAGYTSTTNCLNPPCATMVPGTGQAGFTNILNNEVLFNWQTSCNHLGFQASNCGQTRNDYVFEMRMEDDWCPAPAIGTATVVIRVNSYIPIPPDLTQSCITTAANGARTFDIIPPPDTGRGYSFDYYVVFFSTSPAGPFLPIDTIFTYNTNSFTHGAPPAGAGYYYMRTYGGCGLRSIPSDTLSNLVLNFAVPNPGIAFLEWSGGSASATYRIQRELPAGTGNWVTISTVSGLTYNDTITVCGDDLSYRVELDAPSGICGSNVVTDFFSDQVNDDRMVMDSVTVINGQAVISWIPSTTGDIVEYSILKFTPGTGWVPIDVLPAASLSLPYTYLLSDAENQSEMFKVVSIDSCGNQSSDLIVDAHRTIHLRYFNSACQNLTRLDWNSYIGWPGGVRDYLVLAQVTDFNGGITVDTLAINAPNDTSYEHTTMISGYSYCYTIVARDSSGLLTSSSNNFCINALVTTPSEFLYLASASVLPDGGAEITGFIDGASDVKFVRIERAENIIGPYELVAALPNPGPPFRFQFSDFNARTADFSYYYRLVAVDSCDAVDTTSNIARTILTKVRKNGNMTNTVYWNHYEGFGGGVQNYALYRSVDGSTRFELVTDQIAATDTAFLDDIRAFGDGKGEFCYYVMAREGLNPDGFLQTNGDAFTALSNPFCTSHDVKIFIPNAFNPNSDIPENTVWRPRNIFSQPGTYELRVFDRWGNEVFHTDDPKNGWDGNIRGQQAPMGVYVFFVKYKSKEDFAKEERGSFTLIR
jgi:gliding motility-associated-like protein